MTDQQVTLLDPRWDPHQTELGEHDTEGDE
jgi:hypothetical protein